MSVGLSNGGFDLDLRQGKLREGALGKLLAATAKTVEVKSDRKCRNSGNLFVEYRQKGRPSGIATTTADYWAFEFDVDNWLIVPTEKLRQIARKIYRRSPRNRVHGGDFDQYEGVLLPVAMLVR